MNNSQRRLLDCLKTRGPQSVKLLASQLDMTAMGVRQHLSELASAGLVACGEQRQQRRGRPLRLWQLSDAGHKHFPDRHDLLASDLIDQLQSQLGEQAAGELIEASVLARLDKERLRLDQLERELPGTADAAKLDQRDGIHRRLQALVALRSEQGYMAELRLLPNAWLLVQNHCPIVTAATRNRSYCSGELKMLNSLLGPSVLIQRSDHIASGSRRCAFRISMVQPGTLSEESRAA